MKKNTFIFGVVSSFLLLIGVGLKIQHWPGGGIVMTIAVALFAFGYSVLLLLDKNAFAKNNFQKFVNATSMVAMMLIIIAFLFKAQHWPGAGQGIILGHLLLLIMIPLLFLQASKESDPVKKLNFHNVCCTHCFFILYLA
jgi:hypothetical protein